MTFKIKIQEQLLEDKPWWKSLTLWGAIAYGVADVLRVFSEVNPELLLVAQAITVFLIALGIRRRIK